MWSYLKRFERRLGAACHATAQVRRETVHTAPAAAGLPLAAGLLQSLMVRVQEGRQGPAHTERRVAVCVYDERFTQ